MSTGTKLKLKQVVYGLLKEKPIKEITVKEIVSICDLNRNSFYYHYSGIPEIVEEIVLDQAKGIIDRRSSSFSPRECLESLIRDAYKYKNVILNVYNSSDRIILENSIWNVCDDMVRYYSKDFAGHFFQSEEEYECYVQFLNRLTFGSVVKWLDGEMEEDMLSSYILFEDMVKRILFSKGEERNQE